MATDEPVLRWPTRRAARPGPWTMHGRENMSWSIEDSLELYNVEGWGIGFFGIDPQGRLTVHPGRDPDRGLDLFELAMDFEEQGVTLPLLVRFSDILRHRVESLTRRFRTAMDEFQYDADYSLVYPIKVNQQRHVVDEILSFGADHGVGLEVGSKPELMAVLALSERTDHLIVCNGYKDEEYVRLALMAQKLGHDVLIVIEKINEVDTILHVADEMDVLPGLGVRVKLSSTGAGRWHESGGERSKFGLSAAQLVRVVDLLRDADRLAALRMVHFHIGSQVPDIHNVKAAMTEVGRFYIELRRLGVDLQYVDVGGGLGVDYDGTRSTSAASVNYSIQEYANDIVYALAETCRAADEPMPHIISESGRALTAHHALLLINVIDIETQIVESPGDVPEDADRLVHELAGTLREIDSRDLREIYHDATYAKNLTFTRFNSGVLGLADRARAEGLYLAIMRQVEDRALRDPDEYADILPELETILTDRYFCNFSLFQSLPDSWAIDQIFPIMPVHRLHQEPTRRGTLQDVTCDSDGKIDHFPGEWEPRRSLPLHEIRPGEPYILGILLSGAYQEILGDLHNLFGDTNAVHIRLSEQGYEVTDLVHGDTTTEVLDYVQFDTRALVATFRRKVRNAGLPKSEANAFIADYIDGLAGYTYLEGEAGLRPGAG